MTATGFSGSAAIRNGIRRGLEGLVRLCRRGTLLVVALALTAIIGSTVASAYWLSAGSGTATATVGTLAAPTDVAVPATSAASVPVTWTASGGALTPSGYYVSRTRGDATTAACGSNPTTLITGHSCTDTLVPNGHHTYTVTAVYRSWSSDSRPSSPVAVSTPDKLVFTTEPGDIASGAMYSPAVTVSLRTGIGDPLSTAGVSVALAIGTNPNSGTLSGTTTVLTDTSGAATFSNVSIDKAGTGYTLSATSSGVTGAASASFTVAAAAASKLVITSAGLTGSATSVANIGPLTLQRQDPYGNPVTTGSTVVTLGSNSTGTKKFAASSGGATITTITIPGGASSASVFYADTKAASPTLTVSAAGLTAGSQTASITPAAVSKLAFTTTARTGTASTAATIGPMTAQRRDTFNNPVTTGTTTINFSSNSTGTSKFAAISGGSAITSITVNPGASSGSVYYADTKAGSPSITATATGLTSVSQAATINPAAASKLAIISTALSGPAASTANIGPLTAQRQDTFGNPVTSGTTTVNLASNSTGTKLFSATPGGTAVTAVTVTAGTSTTTAYYGDTKAGSPLLTITATGLTQAAQGATITPAAASGLSFGQQPTTTTQNSPISPAPTVRVVDQYGNHQTAVQSGPSVLLTLTGCGDNTSTGDAAVLAAKGTATFMNFRPGGLGGSCTLTASSDGLGSVLSSPFTVQGP